MLCFRGPVQDGDCTFAGTSIASGNPFGEVYGAESYCFVGTLIKNAYLPQTNAIPHCYKVACQSSTSYSVSLAGGVTVTCSAAGKH